MQKTTMVRYFYLLGVLLLVGPIGLSAAEAPREVSLGAPLNRQDAGLTISASYEAPLSIEGMDSNGRPLFFSPDKTGLFLAVDVRGAKGNKNGFGSGEVVPYLSVSYTLRQQDRGEVQQGQLHPLVTRQGMKYGNNVKLAGPGTYILSLTIEPPLKVGFGRHTDLETGVARWWKPFQVEWTFQHSPSAK